MSQKNGCDGSWLTAKTLLLMFVLSNQSRPKYILPREWFNCALTSNCPSMSLLLSDPSSSLVPFVGWRSLSMKSAKFSRQISVTPDTVASSKASWIKTYCSSVWTFEGWDTYLSRKTSYPLRIIKASFRGNENRLKMLS